MPILGPELLPGTGPGPAPGLLYSSESAPGRPSLQTSHIPAGSRAAPRVHHALRLQYVRERDINHAVAGAARPPPRAALGCSSTVPYGTT